MVGDRDAEAARVRAYRLIEAAQDEGSGSVGTALNDLEAEARLRGWPEVSFLVAAARVLRRQISGHGNESAEAVQQLVRRGVAIGSPALTGLALALRGLAAAGSGDIHQLHADVGRAIALQDDESTPALDRAAVFVFCAAAYNTQRLWELVDLLYDRADAVESQSPDGVQTAAIAVNRVLVRLEWAAGLFEVGQESDAARLLVAADAAAQAAGEVDRMPRLWQRDVEALTALLRLLRLVGMAGDPVVDARDVEHQVSEVLLRRAELSEAGDVEVVPLLDAFVSLALLRHNQSADLEVSTDRASAWIGSATDLSTTTGSRSFPTWVRAEVLRPAAVDAPLAAVQAYAAQVSRLRWATRLGSLDAARARIEVERLAVRNADLSRDVLLDPLTGLSNRRAFDAWLRDDHTSRPAVALVLVDLDDFKLVNDDHGHAVGDEVLRRIGRLLAAHVRPGDLALRLGGDEFAVVLQDEPSRDQLDVLEVVAACRAADVVEAVTTTDWERIVPGLSVRVSVGFAVARLSPEDPEAADRLYRAADSHLYESKSHARRSPGAPGSSRTA